MQLKFLLQNMYPPNKIKISDPPPLSSKDLASAIFNPSNQEGGGVVHALYSLLLQTNLNNV